MKNKDKKIIKILIILLIISLSIIFLFLLKQLNVNYSFLPFNNLLKHGCSQIGDGYGCIIYTNPQTAPSKNNQTPNYQCGIVNCHGMDIKCGTNKGTLCTAVYQIGDGCRQFAKCEITDKGCQFVTNPKFEKCKSCVLDCIKNTNQTQVFECEQNCL